MIISQISEHMAHYEPFDQVLSHVQAGKDYAVGIAGSARPLMVASLFAQSPRCILVVLPAEDGCEAFVRHLATYVGLESIAPFPARTDTPFSPKRPDPDVVSRRARAAWALQTNQPLVVVASAHSLIRLLPPAAERVFAPLRLSEMSAPLDCATGELLDFDQLASALVVRGYLNTQDQLEGPGTFFIQGGSLHVHPGASPWPFRVDFFGDEVDEMRRVVASTGQSISSVDEIEIFPVVEYRPDRARLRRAASAIAPQAEISPVWRELYGNALGGEDFPGADALLAHMYDTTVPLSSYATSENLLVLCEPRSVFDEAGRAYDSMASRAAGTQIPIDGLYCTASSFDFSGCPRLTLASIMRVGAIFDAEMPVKRTEVAGDSNRLLVRLRGLIDSGFLTIMAVPDRKSRQDIALFLVDNGFPIHDASGPGGKLEPRVVNLVDLDVPLGMVIPKAHLGLVSIHDTQGRASMVRNRRRVDITEVTFPFKPGDYVVHASHGVALFKDMVRQEMDGTLRDYLLLEYAEGDKLFVPVEQLDRVTRYVGPEGATPRRTRLNTADWSRALAKARKATKELAFDLVDVYTRRANVSGFAYSPDGPWQLEMEDAFAYEETPDQLSAIADVKADMESSKPMDRLICGDVGFGKTEVALRAAFKAVADHKQVMVLCPTTILAQQHFNTFKDRFAPFDITVEVLSRFRSQAQQRQALAGFAEGSVQVLVGTHRLLSRDVNPRDLGLVIIDEEQRFGVEHKEQMKHLREQIDVLTLSATPIPRTMQMSLSGVRDMSLILTPPPNRQAVKVHVGEWDVDLVSAAIRLEMQRGGQVYYLSNRVRTISEAVERVSQAVPEARIGVAHGQMGRDELERVMEEFNAGLVDVLVSTTIIESGIDNPLSNTLIIEDSQRLGLAQLYQLKGRVGRSSVQAYAYFMFPEHVSLTEEAMQRLDAINEYRDLGSGMRVAMRDLEIRGAGSLLGAEQSGNVSAVGFDLFAQMLATAVKNAREGVTDDSGLPEALSDITVNLPIHSYLPESYVPDADERVLLYRRIACLESIEAVEELYNTVKKERPNMPVEAENLFMKARIRAWANMHKVKVVSVSGGNLTIYPVDKPADPFGAKRREGVKYLDSSRKLVVPLRSISPDGEGSKAPRPAKSAAALKMDLGPAPVGRTTRRSNGALTSASRRVAAPDRVEARKDQDDSALRELARGQEGKMLSQVWKYLRDL